jgi:hypothetical protein
MSHSSQRRGLNPARPGQELIVLAMIPRDSTNKDGIGSAMSALGLKMLAYDPACWISKNYTEIAIPQLWRLQGPLEWLHQSWPDATGRLLLRLVARSSSVITAIYTDVEDVVDLISDLKGDWLEKNRERGYPISIVLSGLFDDVQRCCQKTGSRQHTYLHSLGFFGRIRDLPSESELEIITMCGHGLIAANRVRGLAQEIRLGEISPAEAAESVVRPCVCGIVNRKRAEEIFSRLARTWEPDPRMGSVRSPGMDGNAPIASAVLSRQCSRK